MYRRYTLLRAPSTCVGGVAVLALDEERRNIHTITSEGENESITKSISVGLDNGIPPI